MTHLMELANPGPLRDKLVAAVLSGAKTTTTGLVAGYESDGAPLPEAGQRRTVIDSAGRAVATVEVTAVDVRRLADVDLQHVLDEGEGDTSVAQWKAGHTAFWESPEIGAFPVDDDSLVVMQRFRLV